jgi:hypothetical protein
MVKGLKLADLLRCRKDLCADLDGGGAYTLYYCSVMVKPYTGSAATEVFKETYA